MNIESLCALRRVKQAAALLAAALALVVNVGAAPAAPTAALPGDSLLQLSGVFSDQGAHRFQLAQRRGDPQLIGMFYASCQSVCPLLIETTTAVTAKLPAADRNRVKVLLVSFDPQRDTTQELARVAAEHHLDASRWTLARADANVVRRLAAALDIRYRKLANGEFNHTSALVLVDAQGRMLARTEKLGATPDPEFVNAIRKTLQGR